MDIAIGVGRSRLILAISVMISVVSVTVASLTLLGRGSSHNPAHSDLTAAIAEATAGLNLKPGNMKSEPARAIQVRDAVGRGDYPTARQIAAAALSDSRMLYWRYYPFDDFMAGIADLNDPAFEIRLNAWVEKDKSDAIPLLIRARYYFDLGWFKRGHGFSRETRSENMSLFQSNMKKALSDTNVAIHLGGSGPYVFNLRLLILRGAGMSKDMTDAFEEGINAYPDYYQLYDILLSVLQPKWGGTVEAMYAFLDQYVSHTPEYSPLRLLYLDLFRNLLNAASVACADGQRDHDQMPQCVKSELARTIRPGLNESVLSALRLYDHSDRYQFGAAIDQILFDMLETAGGDAYSGAMLQLVANAMHSDTQLNEERPDHNNYIIDKAVSISWYVKGFYDNALKKDQEALRDIETTTFPSAEAKDLAIADIYEYIAGTYNKLGKYLEMIVYQKAAVSLSGRSEGKHLICYGYYKLGDYERSIRECTDSLTTESDSLQARYWRGAAYRELGRVDAALQDFTIVADSEDSFRAGAAIDISMIYFNRNDVKGALTVLNKYEYLYDPKTTSKSNVAVSYNNRCYAHMRLGELKLALDDCTASLRYGSLPDALRKQQELLKQLGT